jgi:ankyrin repeat protein
LSIDDLLEAIASNDESRILQLLSDGVDVNAIGSDRARPLTLAVELLRPQLVRLLLNAGAHVEGADGYGRLPLTKVLGQTDFHAAQKGASMHDAREIILQLLESGADIRTKSKSGAPVLVESFGSPENLDCLYRWALQKTGNDAKKAAKLFGLSPKKFQVIADGLVEWRNEEAKTRAVQLPGSTAPPPRSASGPSLNSAARASNSLTGSERAGALVEACAQGDRAVIRECLFDPRAAHASAVPAALQGIRAPSDWNAYTVSAALDKLESLAEVWTLAPPDSVTAHKALAAAVANGREAAARWLIAHGAPATSPLRSAPIDFAVAASFGQPALVAAAAGGQLGCLSMLLSSGADPNDADPEGWSPLHAAAAHGHVDIVEALVRHGANPTIKDSDGDSAADRSCDLYQGPDAAERKQRIAELLRKTAASKALRSKDTAKQRKSDVKAKRQ